MQLAIYLFEVAAGVKAYVGYKSQVPQVNGKLIKVIEVPKDVGLPQLIKSTISCTPIDLAPYIKHI